MPERGPLVTRQTMLILSILMDNAEPVAGSAMAATSGLASGTLYPILIRLEEAGWIESDWQEASGREAKPRRRLYRLTAYGAHKAREEAMAWKPLVERFA